MLSVTPCWQCIAGDMPVALMHDGPSLGGFVCPTTITSSALWKMGQCRAGDGIKFKPTTLGERPCFVCCLLCCAVCCLGKNLGMRVIMSGYDDMGHEHPYVQDGP